MEREYFSNENEIEQVVKLLNTGAYYEPETIYFVIDTPEQILSQALYRKILNITNWLEIQLIYHEMIQRTT